jgi:[ribosomal protein S18]-alanine N-acetyltransferase
VTVGEGSAPLAAGRRADRSPRLATLADLPALAALDAACFGNPWSADVYAEELARAFARVRVLEAAGAVVALSCAWVVADEAHLLRIATAAQVRRQGLGRRLVQALLDEAQAARCQHVLLEVAARNAPAVALYEALGFRRIGRRKGYYARPPDDALVMRRPLVLPPSGDPVP